MCPLNLWTWMIPFVANRGDPGKTAMRPMTRLVALTLGSTEDSGQACKMRRTMNTSWHGFWKKPCVQLDCADPLHTELCDPWGSPVMASEFQPSLDSPQNHSKETGGFLRGHPTPASSRVSPGRQAWPPALGRTPRSSKEMHCSSFSSPGSHLGLDPENPIWN